MQIGCWLYVQMTEYLASMLMTFEPYDAPPPSLLSPPPGPLLFAVASFFTDFYFCQLLGLPLQIICSVSMASAYKYVG